MGNPVGRRQGQLCLCGGKLMGFFQVETKLIKTELNLQIQLNSYSLLNSKVLS